MYILWGVRTAGMSIAIVRGVRSEHGTVDERRIGQETSWGGRGIYRWAGREDNERNARDSHAYGYQVYI